MVRKTRKHTKKSKKTNGVFVTQGGKEGYYLGKISITFNEEWEKEITGELISMTLEMPNDPKIENLITIYEDRTGHINPRKKELIGKIDGNDH